MGVVETARLAKLVTGQEFNVPAKVFELNEEQISALKIELPQLDRISAQIEDLDPRK